MLTEKKFLSLKGITRLLKLADEAKNIRDALLAGSAHKFTTLDIYVTYCVNNNLLTELWEEFNSLLFAVERRHILEKSHILYHRLSEMAGYPVSEKQFITVTGDDKERQTPIVKSELVIILENLRSAFNVGSIIRSAEGFAVKKVYLGGFTPGADHREVKKTSKEAEAFCEVESVNDLNLLIWSLKEEGYQIVAMETALNSTPLNEVKFKGKTAILLGNEEIGLTESTLNMSDITVEIKMHGFKNSLNVANAASIALYEYNRQFMLI